MTLHDYTLSLNDSEIKELLAHEPERTGRIDEYKITHTYTTPKYDIEVNCFFLVNTIEHGSWNKDPQRDTSWDEHVVDTDSVEFDIFVNADYYDMDETTREEIIKQLKCITF